MALRRSPCGVGWDDDPHSIAEQRTTTSRSPSTALSEPFGRASVAVGQPKEGIFAAFGDARYKIESGAMMKSREGTPRPSSPLGRRGDDQGNLSSSTCADRARAVRSRYWQVIPCGHCAANAPSTVTCRVVSVTLAAVNENVPRTTSGDELVMTSSPDVALNISVVPPLLT